MLSLLSTYVAYLCHSLAASACAVLYCTEATFVGNIDRPIMALEHLLPSYRGRDIPGVFLPHVINKGMLLDLAIYDATVCTVCV